MKITKKFLHRVYKYAVTYGFLDSIQKAWGIAPRLFTIRGLPLSILVEVSNCCNMHCEYCVLDDGAQGDRVMSNTTFANVLPYLRNTLRIYVSGLAEPLMNNRFTSMLADIRRIAPYTSIQMCTNGALLTRKISKNLLDQKLDALFFSLDGVDAKKVDNIRLGGSLVNQISNIKTLHSLKRERSSKKPLIATTVVLQKKNVEQLPAIIKLSSQLGIKVVGINGLEPYVDNMVDAILWNDPSIVGQLKIVLSEASTAAAEANIELRLPAFRPQPAICTQISRPIILADGTVVPCSVLAYPRGSFLYVDKSESTIKANGVIKRLSFGNVNERSFKSIWMDKEYLDFRRNVQRGSFPPPCKKCLMKHHIICPVPHLNVEQCLNTLRATI